MLDPAQRSLLAKEKAHRSWAATSDRSQRTEPGRRAADKRFEIQARELHPEADEATIAQVAESLRKAHYAKLARLSAAVRSARGARARRALVGDDAI